MSDLPASWVETTLGEIASLITKGTTPTSLGFHFQSSGIPFVKIENIKDWKINKSSIGDFISNECHDALKRSQLAEGDVLFSIAGTIGKTAVVDKDSIPANTNQAVAIIRGTSNVILPRLLMLELAFLADDFAKKNARGGAMNNISLGDIKSLTLSIPPLNEQKRITDKLNSLLARVDSCQTHLERVPQILKRFRQSVLAAATSGRLTEDWREKQGRDLSDWTETTVGNLIDDIEAGINYKCEERPPLSHERGLVKISAVTWSEFNDEESKTLPTNRDVPKSTRIKVGDFLISRANTIELVAACVIVKQVNRPVYLSDKVLRIVMRDEIKLWLLYWLRSSYGRSQIESLASGNQLSMRNISQANLKLIQVNLPKQDEIDEIVRRVEKLFTYAAKLETRYTSASEHVERLTPSLLAKAFRGELVGQDAGDEFRNKVGD